jgi:hypothetical protein
MNILFEFDIICGTGEAFGMSEIYCICGNYRHIEIKRIRRISGTNLIGGIIDVRDMNRIIIINEISSIIIC